MKRHHPSFRLKTLATVASLFFAANTAWAVTPFVIKDIKVEGLQRVDASTIFASIPVKVGDTYDDEHGAASIRSLFALGLFQDVRIEVRDSEMVVVVQERPSINQVDISAATFGGMDKNAILKGLGTLGIVAGRPYDKGMEDRAIQELLKQYQSMGYYAAEIVPTVTPIDRNRVNLSFAIKEGKIAQIKQIRFVGNSAFSASTLQDEMQMDTGGWMSWYTKSNRYADNKLNADLEALRNFYRNRGYLEFQINSTQVGISPDKRDIEITINLSEGEKYVVSAVSLAGDYLEKEDAFKSLISIKPGEAYKQADVATTLAAMKKHFGNYGYAFAKIEARPKINREKQQVELVLAAEPGQRAYVRRINIAGNAKTRDEVIRRELRQYEASWYNSDKIALSKDRLERLGYFTDISIEPQQVSAEATDQADLDITVKERPTGAIQIGAGYSTSDKIEARPKINREKQQVELVLAAEPGQRAYVRRINIAGNAKTRDEVIRRELRQYEASWYNSDKIALSKDRLERLGYFTDISIEPQQVSAEATDQADLDITVKERPTGAIQIGAGYSTSDKISLSFNLNQDNVFGSGQSLALGVNTGSYNRTYSISSTDPYFTNYGISRTFYFSHAINKPRKGQGGDYSIRQDNAGISFGVPFSETDQVYFGLGLERYGIRSGTTDMPPVYRDYINYYGKSAYGVPLSIGWGRDSRDSALAPTSGTMQRVSAVLSPAGGLKYFNATYKFQQYFPLSKNTTIMFNTDLGYGKGLSCKKGTSNCYPFYKNFFMGGIGSVRGFDQGAIGPSQIDPVTNSSYSVGGNKMFNANIEFIAPFPGANNDKTLRLFAFLDAGNVYADSFSNYKPTSEDRMIRASAGVGLRWISPMGPLSLSFAHPFRKQKTDKLQKFQFQIGASF